MGSKNHMSLNSSASEINIIIRKNIFLDDEVLRSYLDFNCSNYAYICHSQDINEKGELEGVHYHIVALYYSRKRKSTILKEICEIFGFDNADYIEVDKLDSLAGGIQYLTHKNYPLKVQHEYSEIVYKWDEKEFKELYDKNFTYSFDYVYNVICGCKSYTDIIRSLGISYYQRNRATLIDIFNGIVHNEK